MKRNWKIEWKLGVCKGVQGFPTFGGYRFGGGEYFIIFVGLSWVPHLSNLSFTGRRFDLGFRVESFLVRAIGVVSTERRKGM